MWLCMVEYCIPGSMRCRETVNINVFSLIKSHNSPRAADLYGVIILPRHNETVKLRNQCRRVVVQIKLSTIMEHNINHTVYQEPKGDELATLMLG